MQEKDNLASARFNQPDRQALIKEGIKDSRGRKNIPLEFKDMPVPATDNRVRGKFYQTGTRCKICNQYSTLRPYIEEMLIKGVPQKKICAWANYYGAKISEMNLSEHKKRHFRQDEMIAQESEKQLTPLIKEIAASNIRSLDVIVEKGLEAISENLHTPTPSDTIKAIGKRADISGGTPLSQLHQEMAKALAKRRKDDEAEEIEAEIVDEPE